MERPSLPELRVPAAPPRLAGRPPHLRIRKRLVTPAPVPPVLQPARPAAPPPAATEAPPAAIEAPPAATEAPPAAESAPSAAVTAAPEVPELPSLETLSIATPRPAEPDVRVAEIAPPKAAAWGVCHRVALPEAPVPVAPPAPNPAVGIVGAGVAGMVASVVIALAASGGFSGDWSATGDQAAVAEQPVVAEAASVVDTEPVPAVEPKPIVVPIDNTVAASFTAEPEGARITLVEDGEPIPLGLAPVEARLDPNRAYELLVEHEDYWSDVRLIVFEDGDVREHVELTRKDAPTVAQTAPVARRARRAPAGKRRATRARPAATEMPDGKGILMLHAKPPCAIEIDGRDTGLTTPRRDIALTPGRHRITLVNRDHGIREQLFVTIREGRELKVSKDLTDRMAVDVPRL